MMKCRLLFLNKTRSFSGMLTKTIFIKIIVIYCLYVWSRMYVRLSNFKICLLLHLFQYIITLLNPPAHQCIVPIPCSSLNTHHVMIVFSKVFHVRPVTQGDVIRADAKDIPRIFQVNLNKSHKICTLVKLYPMLF